MLTFSATVTSDNKAKKYELQVSNLPEAAKQAIRWFLDAVEIDEQAPVSVTVELQKVPKVREIK